MVDSHIPVLLDKTIKYLKIKKTGTYLDGTLGRGGHTAGILDKLDDKGQLIAIDRDLKAINEVKEKIKNDNLILEHGNYIDIDIILDKYNIDLIDGMIFDLGVSSPQLDNFDRGFSYKNNGPLDMRMNRDQKLTAAKIVNEYRKEKIEQIISDYGEENWAARIAEFIVAFRKKKKIETTFELVDIIKAAIPASARRSGGHPARRTFQALRIATNNELNQLEEMIKKAVSRLKEKGRICIISFHSLEDRIVKHKFKELASNCICPPEIPVCVCDKEPQIKIITKKPVRASEKEVQNNYRSRSAKLRVAEKI
ncbi:MAG: 16S rRNA (cytosine(1402)-N(4))-methyltransferase RsmH [Halanaerobiales bacterium]|nr:16S rRNA (cytosine(1402)-N(4))-methyltransferase RsmH [Halanaerobiales bacterium]